MGRAAAIYGSILESTDDGIRKCLTFIRLPDHAFVSDHFDRAVAAASDDGLLVEDGTLLLPNVNRDEIEMVSVDQRGTITSSRGRYNYYNQFSFGPDDRHCVFFCSLPAEHYPSRFHSGEPHFAAFINGRVRMTWWFRAETTIQFAFARNPKRAMTYAHKSQASFLARHPLLNVCYDQTQAVAAKIAAELIGKNR